MCSGRCWMLQPWQWALLAIVDLSARIHMQNMVIGVHANHDYTRKQSGNVAEIHLTETFN